MDKTSTTEHETGCAVLTKLQARETKQEGESHIFGNPLHYLSIFAQLFDSNGEVSRMTTDQALQEMNKHSADMWSSFP